MSEQENKNKHSTPDNQSGGDQQKGNQGFQWKQAGKTSLIWVIILISAIFVSGLFTGTNGDEVELKYYEYEQFRDSEIIASAEIIENNFHGKL
ncbi:MAG TPA: cell division protein FtsH, partial [Candidatus Marinimicrobia bacterium]|nr:cell division protein FtsH [Candidatus Neomarinimicrobiota bacterium]